jgi:ketosteroid isomerase-like protein
LANGDGIRSRVEGLFDAFNGRDVERAIELCDPEVEFFPVTAEMARGGQAYLGHHGVREYFADLERVWDELRVTAGEVRKVDDAVLVIGRVVAQEKEHGVRDLPAGWVLRFNGPLVRYGRVYADPREAARELGLEPEPNGAA